MDSVGEWTTMSGKFFQVLNNTVGEKYLVASMVQ